MAPEAPEIEDDDLRMALVALEPRLRRFAYGLTRSREDSDDLVQSAYERALGRLGQWQAGTRLDSWMYRIVQTTWFNRLESQAVRKRHMVQFDGADPGYRGDLQIESHITLERVREHLFRLPEDQRAVLLLVAVEGLSYKEASAVLDVPIGTITSRLARARAAMRKFTNGPATEGLKPNAVSES